MSSGEEDGTDDGGGAVRKFLSPDSERGSKQKRGSKM